MSRVAAALRRAAASTTPPQPALGRWCLPVSNPHCDPQLKADWATLDNDARGGGVTRRPPRAVRDDDDDEGPWNHPTVATVVF